MKRAALVFALSLFLLPFALQARTTATFGQNTVGQPCGRLENGADFDTLFQCTSSATSGGTKQTAPLILGTVTAPPYANTTCDSNKAGMLQWTGTAFQGCNGTSWVSINKGCDTPNAFSFTDQSEVDRDIIITSNAVTLTGFSCSSLASCSGCSDILRNGSSQGTTGVAFSSGDTIALSLLSSSSTGTTNSATVTIGQTTSSPWSVTTVASSDPCHNSPDVGTVCDDGTVYAGISPDGDVPMYTTPCDVGQTWTDPACTGTKTYAKWSSTGLLLGYTSTITGEYNTAGIASNGSGYAAAYYCQTLSGHGHDDWYLPSQNELLVLSDGRLAIQGFATNAVDYWSSTEYSLSIASTVVVYSGTVGTSQPKSTALLFRCVRK